MKVFEVILTDRSVLTHGFVIVQEADEWYVDQSGALVFQEYSGRKISAIGRNSWISVEEKRK